jgi:hypothetical protein
LKKIVCTEEVWNPRTDKFTKYSCLPEMLEYSLKLMNLRHPSSIMDPGNRQWETYLPESNNMNDLLTSFYTYVGEDKFLWNSELQWIDLKNKIAHINNDFDIEYDNLISTIPLGLLFKLSDIEHNYKFNSKSINITNYRTENIVANWLISIYISDTKFPPFRITILNNNMSMESMSKLTHEQEIITKYHLERYFDYDLTTKEEYTWETGRIFGLSTSEREQIIEIMKEHNVYLLGRYATWDGKMLMDTTIKQANKIINTWIMK